MQHTYLRYECADSFGLISSSASSKAPQSNSILAFASASREAPILLTTAGSHCMGYHLRTTNPTIKIAQRELLSGGVGTGKALNSDQVVCVEVATGEDSGNNNNSNNDTCKVATGWVDGAVRVFDVYREELNARSGCGLVQTLLEDNQDDDFVAREPLLLNGHSGSPVRSLAFDSQNGSRLASGSSDGSVVLWDIVAETGLFRLLGHKGGITDLHFVALRDGETDLLVTTSLDGFVKIWDLKGQCCIQTIPSHRGEVLAAGCLTIPNTIPVQSSSDAPDATGDERIRLITGSTDGQARVWSIAPSKRHKISSSLATATATTTNQNGESSTPAIVEDDDAAKGNESLDDVCHYMGCLMAPPNVSTSAERLSCIHFHPNGKYVGVLHSNSKHVDVYLIRSVQESLRKKQRRLRRRKEKSSKARNAETDEGTARSKGQKRGILDDPESDNENDDKAARDENSTKLDKSLDPDVIKASDEFEYFGTVRASHKLKGFIFVPYKESGGGLRVVCSLATNALEVHSLTRNKESEDKSASVVVSSKISTMSMGGHPTGIRAVELSSDDALACTVSKNTTKIWNVKKRSCVQSLVPSVNNASCYGLCTVFLPGNTHLVLGTREGHLLVLDIAAGDVVYVEENAHDGAIWSMDMRRPTAQQPSIAIVTGSADKTVKFWELESQEDSSAPMLVHSRTLEMSDDVIAVRYSHSTDPTKRMVFVSSLDSTIKVFFDDTLKFFLSLYGHKLPALAVDCSDDDVILASSGADKTIKIWGLDFGDTHRTLHGHEDSVTDLRFVRRTHNFFTTSKDNTVRYWDGDRFEQILILNGHFAEVSCLSISRTGAFVVTGGLDRQVRVWERTKDMVFLEEERERELEQMFDGMGREEDATGRLLKKKGEEKDGDDDGDEDDEPQSEAAVKRSVLSVAAGDRIMEALERADQEKKEAALFRKKNPGKEKTPNPLLLGMEPALYFLWVLKSVKQAELEQSLLVLPLGHVERVLYYLILLLRSGRGVEICARVSVFLVKTHQNQIMASRSTMVPLRELRRLLRERLSESRDTIGFNLAALRAVARTTASKKESYLDYSREQTRDIWAGMGLGSDLAAALENRRPAR
mmetsp:Transcript_20281/g.56409  ORF Transcript_20281/g.56409 Transcript_20281/m.56409 type:complete len:1101 (+) Transcript_20281:216-3518(+)